MGRMTFFIIFFSIFSLLGFFAGFTEGSPLTTLLMHIQDIQTTSMWAVIITIGALAVAGVVTTSFITIRPDLAAMAGIALFYLNSFMDVVTTFSTLSGSPVIQLIYTVIFAPLMIAFLATIVDWWRSP